MHENLTGMAWNQLFHCTDNKCKLFNDAYHISGIENNAYNLSVMHPSLSHFCLMLLVHSHSFLLL